MLNSARVAGSAWMYAPMKSWPWRTGKHISLIGTVAWSAAPVPLIAPLRLSVWNQGWAAPRLCLSPVLLAGSRFAAAADQVKPEQLVETRKFRGRFSPLKPPAAAKDFVISLNPDSQRTKCTPTVRV